MTENQEVKKTSKDVKSHLEKTGKNLLLFFLWMLIIYHHRFTSWVTEATRPFLPIDVVDNLGLIISLLLCLGLLCLLLIRWRFFVLWLLAFIFFPFKILLWIIPRYLYKILRAFYIVPKSAYKLTSSLRFNLLIIVIGVLSFLAITHHWYIKGYWGYIVVLNLVSLLLYCHLLRFVTNPTMSHKKGVSLLSQVLGKQIAKCRELKSQYENNDKSSEQKWKNESNTLSGHIKLLRDLSNFLSKINNPTVVTQIFIMSVIFYFIFVVCIFGIQYYGLETYIPGSFLGLQQHTIFNCIYFSFTHSIGNGYGEIRPLLIEAKALSSIQTLYILAIAVVLFLIFSTLTLSRYERDLSVVITELTTMADEGEALLSDKSGEARHVESKILPASDIKERKNSSEGSLEGNNKQQ